MSKTTLTRPLQRQLSNGAWRDVPAERVEEFLGECEKNSGLDRSGVIEALEGGRKLRNDPCDWYSNCRMTPMPRRAVEKVWRRCEFCGVKATHLMSTTYGSACSDCYDDASE